MRLRTLDLFCGGGGSSWGARAAGAQIVCAVDSWDLAARTFQANFPRAKVLNVTLNDRSGPEMIGDIGPIDVILASPECTNHTCAKGSGPRDEDSRLTARYVLNFVRKLKPRFVVVENVVHMRSWHGYDPLIDALRNLDYCVSPQILDAVDFGVPQSRKRLFIICDRQRPPADLARSVPRQKSARSVLDPAGTWAVTPLYRPGRAEKTLERAARAFAKLGEGKPFLMVYYGSDGSGGWQTLDRPLRTLTTLDRFGLVTWRRGVPMMRMLQVPELQRAMGFDDDYRLELGVRRDRIKLLGNGVCPPVMQAVIASLSRHSRAGAQLLAAE
jgi:DNA (cytosine-5)-methyltransferase 1